MTWLRRDAVGLVTGLIVGAIIHHFNQRTKDSRC